MGLINVLLGELIEPVTNRNKIGDLNISGVDINKQFISTRANLEGTDITNYKIVSPRSFAANFMHIGRDIKLPVAYNSSNKNKVVSPAYSVFRVKSNKILDAYLFILMTSSEFDRLTWFYTDSSVRGNLDWPRFCTIPLTLPSLSVQQKAVDAYMAISDNLAAYIDGLNDLKMTCDIYMDNIKSEYPRDFIGNLLTEKDVRNRDSKITNVLGINIEKTFMPSVANLNETDISKYKVIEKGQFAYSAMQTGRDETIRVALFNQDEKVVISPAYSVLEVKNDKVLSEYLMVWFKRKESDRYGWFLSDGSVRASLEVKRFFEIEIPIPPISIQQSIVDIYHAQYERQEIADKLNKTLREICPVLIKQSLS